MQAYINRRTTGDPNVRWMAWLAKKFAPKPLERGLCLACGAGTAEIDAIFLNMCREMDACDISNASLKAARKKAESCGISSRVRYFRCDLNRKVFPATHYDIILSSGGLHHVAKLEHLLAEICRALKPGGLLAVDEYVGPSRLQYSDQQLQAVNRILSALPGAVRTGKSATRPAIEFMLSTAIRNYGDVWSVILSEAKDRKLPRLRSFTPRRSVQDDSEIRYRNCERGY